VERMKNDEVIWNGMHGEVRVRTAVPLMSSLRILIEAGELVNKSFGESISSLFV
jgi:hypothetical protein